MDVIVVDVFLACVGEINVGLGACDEIAPLDALSLGQWKPSAAVQPAYPFRFAYKRSRW